MILVLKSAPSCQKIIQRVGTLLVTLMVTLAGCSATDTIDPNVSTIDIDKGTVYLKIATDDNLKSHKITYRPQGTCLPKISIVRMGKYSDASHTMDCHGTGEQQGTIFDVELAPNQQHKITLNAGQIFSPSVSESATIKYITADVSVGGIHGGGKNTKVERTLLLGAKATANNPNLKQGTELFISVNLGGIDFTNNQ